MNVAVIGMGNMGSALADALLMAKHRVTVWNRSAKKCDAAVAVGAVLAPSVDAAGDCCINRAIWPRSRF